MGGQTSGCQTKEPNARDFSTLSIAGTLGATTAFTARDSHAMGFDTAAHALSQPLGGHERKLAVAAIGRQMFAGIEALRAEAAHDTPAGREAAAKLGHLRKELTR